jgi:uncharacterized repeat protein (TIGR01451 family)
MRFLTRSWPALAGLFLAGALLALLQAGTAGAVTQSIVHTSVVDFNPGAFYRTGLTQQSDGEVTLLSVGIAGQWVTTTNAAGFVPRSEHAAIAANNRLYVFGGRTANNTLTSIQYTGVNTVTHNLSNWVTASVSLGGLYPSGISALSAAYLNGYVYLMGGYSSDEATGITSTVAFARIQSDGALSAITKTASLPQRLSRMEAVALNGRVYVIGGRGSDSQGRDTVYYAQPDAATGAITQWLTTTASLPYSAFGHEAFSAEGYLYVAGGVSRTISPPGGVVPNVFYAAPLTDTGDITPGGWISTTVMPFPLYEAASASFGGQLYSTGGSASASLAGAPSDYVGAALPLDSGAIITWVNTSLIYPPRFAHTAVVNTDGWIYLIGGTVGTNQPITASIINAGATTGAGGSSYAQLGRYTSSIVDLKKNYTLQQLNWTTYLGSTSSVSLTMRYRTRTALGSWSDWSASLPSVNAVGTATTTYPLSQTARYYQYEATLTSTNGLTTPILSRVELIYDTPEPPQFAKLAVPASGSLVQAGARVTYTLRYSNTTDSIFHNVVISDRVPISTTYVPSTIFASPGVTPTDSGNPFLVWQIGDLQPHTGGEVGYAITIDASVPEGEQIHNIADLTSDEVDTQTNAVIHTIGTPPVVIKSAITSAPGQVAGTVQPGDRITYTLTYSNPSGVRPLTGVVITDQLPLHLTYVGSIGSPAPDTSLLASSRTLRWFVGTVPTLTQGSLGFVAIVSNTAPSGASIDNTPQIDSNETPRVDGNTHSLAVRYRFDLRLSKTDGKVTAVAGEFLTYTLRITNSAVYPITATGVVITDYLEPGLLGLTQTVLSFAGGSPGWSFVEVDPGGNAIYAYPVGSLGPNQSKAITLVAQVTGTLPAGVLAVRNSAEALDDGQNGIESDPSNQSVSDTDVVAGADLVVTGLSISPAQPTPGATATIRITVTNQGLEATQASDGYGWFWVDLYIKPNGFTPNGPPISPHDRWGGYCLDTYNWPCTVRDPNWYWIGPSQPLAPGQSVSATYTYVFTATGTYRLYAQADVEWPGVCVGPYSMYYCGSPSSGRITEGDETNNISSELAISVGNYRIFLPAVLKNH